MKRIINAEGLPKAGPYSHAVEANGFVFVSGQIPVNPETGRIVDGDIKEQTRQVLENLKTVLKAAGCELKDVVKTTVYLKNLDDFAAMNEVYAEFFTEQPPARAAFQVARLPLDVLVEIEAIAVKK